MEKIRCPHCGALNQDAMPKDKCWQCSKILDSPSSGTLPPATENTPRPLEERVALRKAERLARQRARLYPIAIFILIAILIIVIALVLHNLHKI